MHNNITRKPLHQISKPTLEFNLKLIIIFLLFLQYSPMEIPDEVYERYFRGQNPWDYGGSPLPFWTPPKV